MKKVVGLFLILTVISILIYRVDSVTVMVPVEETSQLVSQEMVLIPAGEFQMGSSGDVPDNQTPVHTVYLDAFYIDKYEVTNAHYKEFLDANPKWSKANIDKRFHNEGYLSLWEGDTYSSGKGNHPVEGINWYAAMAYAKWKGKRLPTEAEWEKAARGGLEGQKYPWGNSMDPTKANYSAEEGSTPEGSTPVGTYPPNGYGLYDIVGNVAEWCLDRYIPFFYEVSPRRNPVAGVGEISHLMDNFTYMGEWSRRVIRGGSYHGSNSMVIVGNREGLSARGLSVVGFRCVKPAPSEN